MVLIVPVPGHGLPFMMPIANSRVSFCFNYILKTLSHNENVKHNLLTYSNAVKDFKQERLYNIICI